MLAARIIEAVDIFVEGDLDLTAGLPVEAPDQLGLRRLVKPGPVLCLVAWVVGLLRCRSYKPIQT